MIQLRVYFARPSFARTQQIIGLGWSASVILWAPREGKLTRRREKEKVLFAGNKERVVVVVYASRGRSSLVYQSLSVMPIIAMISP